MSLHFDILGWIGSGESVDPSAATTAALRIRVELPGETLVATRVEDTGARTIRDHVFVPAYDLAVWLVANWWRLRWEGTPRTRSESWRWAHRMNAASHDHVWPPLTVASDGELVHLQMDPESSPDAAGIRYLDAVSASVPASAFEAAVARFVDVVLIRLQATRADHKPFAELWDELRSERTSDGAARLARLQAMAGIDPGEADDAWLERAAAFAARLGDVAGEQVLQLLPDSPEGLAGLEADVQRVRTSELIATLDDWRPQVSAESDTWLPWQRGAEQARCTRAHLGLQLEEVVSDELLGDLFGVRLPVRSGVLAYSKLGGAYRADSGAAHVLVPSPRRETQRFFFGRLLGGHQLRADNDRLIPVTTTYSALQKQCRSFSVELLCPWEALDAFTDDKGTDDVGIEYAGEHFQVSEWAIRSALVNHGKIPRSRLPSA